MKYKIKKIIILMFLYGFLGSAYADGALTTDAKEFRIRKIVYSADKIFTIKATTFINTQIILGEEAIVDVQGGDAAAWSIQVSPYVRNVLNIKPTIPNSSTNLDIISVDASGVKRYYRFQLQSQDFKINKFEPLTYAIQFIYPGINPKNYSQTDLNKTFLNQALVQAAKMPEIYNWNYSFNGAKILKPLQIFDDGKFVYMKFPSLHTLPAIFAVNNRNGQENLVNYRQIENYLVVYELSPQFTLRIGKKNVASIFNNTLIKEWNY